MHLNIIKALFVWSTKIKSKRFKIRNLSAEWCIRVHRSYTIWNAARPEFNAVYLTHCSLIFMSVWFVGWGPKVGVIITRSLCFLKRCVSGDYRGYKELKTMSCGNTRFGLKQFSSNENNSPVFKWEHCILDPEIHFDDHDKMYHQDWIHRWYLVNNKNQIVKILLNSQPFTRVLFRCAIASIHLSCV